MSEPFIGEIKAMPYNYAPRGWAFCRGQLLDIRENTELYAVIGTIYGGDGRTTFALPNLEDRAPLGQGSAPGLSYHPIGIAGAGGVPTIPLSTQNLPQHNHKLDAYSGDDATEINPVGKTLGKSPVTTKRGQISSQYKHYAPADPDIPPVAMADDALQATGQGMYHDNMQPYLTLNYCIALIGIFPSRN